jgi:hypothetical protein
MRPSALVAYIQGLVVVRYQRSEAIQVEIVLHELPIHLRNSRNNGCNRCGGAVRTRDVSRALLKPEQSLNRTLYPHAQQTQQIQQRLARK